jgi:aminoglycoside phosphotransferase (APT) family kinase protein
MILRSTQAPAIAIALRQYLREKLGVPELGYRSPPEAMPDGMEAYTFRLQLQGRALPPAYRAPLVLRLYASANGLPNLRHESRVQGHMAHLGFPVARPVHVEEDCDALGGPFMLMECLPGIPLLDSLFRYPWEIAVGPFQMGALHARLHDLPAAGFPAPRQPYLERWLNTLQERIDGFELQSLQPGLDWLRQQRPPDPDVPSILHLDYHPINLLYRRLGITGVLDWPEADVGDAHADLATTLMLMETTEVPAPNLLGRLLRIPGPFLVRRFYLRAYGLKRRIDWNRIGYYKAFAALRRLTRWGMWRRESPEVTGCKRSAIVLLADGGLRALEECFHKCTGLAVRLRVK